jgi:CubicO group peptidase (beta-lactamase class C family)
LVPAKISLFVIVLAAACADPLTLPPSKEPKSPPPACEPLAATLNRLADDFDRALGAAQVPGGAFSVVSGDCLFTHGVGVDAEGEPIDGHTRFQLASVSKLFTAITANSLAADEAVDKRAPLSTIVDINDAAPYATSFTLDDLLAHRAGYAGWFMDDDGRTLERAPFFRAFASEPLWAAPREVFVYNNQGYALAGHAIEVAGDAPFASLVQARVIDALSLNDTRMGSTLDPNEPGAAMGHSGTPSSQISLGAADPFYRSEIYEPMGGVWSSVHDLALLGRALAIGDERLLPRAWIDDLASSRGPTSGRGGAYGQGLEIYGDLWTHSGATGGFLTELSLAPSLGVMFAAAVSADWHYPYDFAYSVLTTLAPDLDLGTFPDPSAAAEWAGRYVDDVIVGTVDVEARGDDLFLRFVDLDTTMDATFAYDATWFGELLDWGTQELVLQRGAEGTRYLTSRAFVARAID